MWIPVEPANKEGNRTAEFQLGDFAVLGEFLHELAGIARQYAEVQNAK
jgi:hypothetical protein